MTKAQKELAKKLARFYQSDPRTWVKGYFAQNSDGTAVHPTDEDACRWCISGLAMKLEPNRELRLDFLKNLAAKTGVQYASIWNDAGPTTFSEVITTLEAIACE